MTNLPRRSPRVACAMPARWTRRRQELSGEVKRCNLHGMFIETGAEVELGFMIDLTIEMPWGPMSCTAVPRYVGVNENLRGIGVELHVMDRGDRELWAAHYRRVLAERKT